MAVHGFGGKESDGLAHAGELEAIHRLQIQRAAEARGAADREQCSIARTVELLGDWWTPLVLREAFYGVRRFAEFQESLGIARNILTQRLRRLEHEGLLERRRYPGPARSLRIPAD